MHMCYIEQCPNWVTFSPLLIMNLFERKKFNPKLHSMFFEFFDLWKSDNHFIFAKQTYFIAKKNFFFNFSKHTIDKQTNFSLKIITCFNMKGMIDNNLQMERQGQSMHSKFYAHSFGQLGTRQMVLDPMVQKCTLSSPLFPSFHTYPSIVTRSGLITTFSKEHK